MKIKLFVDDIRSAPSDDWVVSRNVNEAIRTIAQFECEEISLDHDISHQLAMETGVSRPYPCSECFCAVAYFIGEKYWIDRKIDKVVDKFEKDEGLHVARPLGGPKLILHTSSPIGAEKMKNILQDYGLTCIIKMTGISNRLEMEV